MKVETFPSIVCEKEGVYLSPGDLDKDRVSGGYGKEEVVEEKWWRR